MVVPVSDDEFGQRVAAAVSIRSDQSEYRCGDSGPGRRLTIEDLRRDLRGKLAGYKLPTLLRVVEGELPKTASGKVLKKVLGPRFFPPDYHTISEVDRWSSRRLETLAKF